MKPTLAFLAALLLAPLVALSAGEFQLTPEHQAAVNRPRRIFFQYDPAADIQGKGGFGSDMEALMGYVFDFADLPGSQVDAICIDVSNEGVAHYRSKILQPIRHPGLMKWREQGLDYFDELIKHGHQRGKEIWWGLRMNEVERGDLAAYEPGRYAEMKDRNPVKAAHPEWLIRSWWWQGFWNYAVKEVRDYRLSVIREVVEQYDFDGAPSTLTLPVWEPVKPGTEVKLRLVLFNHVEGDEVVAQLNGAALKRDLVDAQWKDARIFSPLPQPETVTPGTVVRNVDAQKLTRIEFHVPVESLKRGLNTLAISVNRTGPFPPSRPVKVEKVELHLK